MSMNDHTQALRRIEAAEKDLEHLGRRIETRSLRACLGLAKAWLEEGSVRHADAICQEVVQLAQQLTEQPRDGVAEPETGAAQHAKRMTASWTAMIAASDARPGSSDPTPAPAAPPDAADAPSTSVVFSSDDQPSRARAAAPPTAEEPTPVGMRLTDLERRLREHFSRELAQAMVAKPWNLDKKQEDRGHGSGLKDQLDLVRASVEDLRRVVQEGAAVSPAEVKALIGAELEANGLESRLNRVATGAIVKATTEAPAPPFVQRLDARLMQLAHAQERVAERMHALERVLARAVVPADASGGKRTDGTGSWLQELEAALPAPGGAAVGGPTEVAAHGVPDAMRADPSSAAKPAVRPGTDPAIEPTEAPTQPFNAGAGVASRDYAAPAAGDRSASPTGPLVRGTARDDDSRIRALIAQELAKRGDTPSPASVAASAMADADLVQRLARVLPDALRHPTVREALFAVLALEAAAQPGALAELTGVRSFLRRELARQVEELKKELAMGEPV